MGAAWSAVCTSSPTPPPNAGPGGGGALHGISPRGGPMRSESMMSASSARASGEGSPPVLASMTNSGVDVSGTAFLGKPRSGGPTSTIQMRLTSPGAHYGFRWVLCSRWAAQSTNAGVADRTCRARATCLGRELSPRSRSTNRRLGPPARPWHAAAGRAHRCDLHRSC